MGPVRILGTPATQEFAAYNFGDALRIRFEAAAGVYEVMAPGQGWDRLADNPDTNNPAHLLFASALQSSRFSTAARHDHEAPELRFQYSSLATWSLTLPGQAAPLGGVTAFGTPTPAGGVPVAGSARYEGPIKGEATFPAPSGWGDQPKAPVGGAVRLDFNFASGVLAGQIRPVLDCDCDPISFPTLDFADTVFGVGSRTFSGRFATTVAGPNAFEGQFMGPNGQELIGQWSFPMIHGGSPGSVSGVWIAKRGD